MIISHYVIRSPRLADVDRCYDIERTAYAGDEAATRAKIKTRIENYPEGFMVLELDQRVVGFINSGCADVVTMSDEAFKELVGHDPQGKHNVIMSVVVDPHYQGRGIASILMANYVLRMRHLGKVSIQLMCREQHRALYEHLGFVYVKPSASDHGGLAWHEMIMPLVR